MTVLPTKTQKSRRGISISSDVIEVLRQIRGTQVVKQVEFGATWIDTGFVFTDEVGMPLDSARVSKEFAKRRKLAGLEGVRLHDLRHTHASMYASSKCPSKGG